MLRSYVTKKHLTFYFLAIVITWLEAIITPALIQYIVASFTNRQLHLLWQILLWGIGGNLVLVLGLAGKRYYYARLMTDFKVGIKRAIFRTFLYSRQIPDEEVLSDLENDVQQLEKLYRADRHYRILARFYSRFHRICPLDQFLSGVIVYHLLLGTSFV